MPVAPGFRNGRLRASIDRRPDDAGPPDGLPRTFPDRPVPAPPRVYGGGLLKFETHVRRPVPGLALSRIRPSIAGIASRRAMIAGRFRSLPRYIPETKNAICGAATRGRCSARCATVDGITHGMLLATVGASASGRHHVTKMWGGQLVKKPVGETAMKTISSSLIRAFLAQQWGSRTDRGIARDAVPASRGAPCRFHGLRAVHALERLSLRATTGRQRRSSSFSSPGWAMLFVPDSLTPIRLRPCRAVSIAPGQCRRWLD